jgi:hypothetical protein
MASLRAAASSLRLQLCAASSAFKRLKGARFSKVWRACVLWQYAKRSGAASEAGCFAALSGMVLSARVLSWRYGRMRFLAVESMLRKKAVLTAVVWHWAASTRCCRHMCAHGRSRSPEPSLRNLGSLSDGLAGMVDEPAPDSPWSGIGSAKHDRVFLPRSSRAEIKA